MKSDVQQFRKRISFAKSYGDLNFVANNFANEILMQQRSINHDEILIINSLYKKHPENKECREHDMLFDIFENVIGIDDVDLNKSSEPIVNSNSSMDMYPRNAT